MLEFYASTEGEAILVNLSGDKPGCKGRPLPGSAEVRLAAYDVGAARLRERADGFAVECGPGEVGMLLTRLRGVVAPSESPLRGLFEPDDAWLATGDLFRADEDGDLWLVDHVAALIRDRARLRRRRSRSSTRSATWARSISRSPTASTTRTPSISSRSRR